MLKQRKRLLLVISLKTFGGIGGLFFILYTIELKKISLIAQKSDFFLLIIGALLSHIAVLLFSLRLQQGLKIFDIRISFFSAYKIHIQSMFYLVFVPISLGMEAVKFGKLYYLHFDSSRPSIIKSLLLDRVIGVISFICLSLLAFIFLKTRIHFDKISINYLFIILIILILSITVILLKKISIISQHLKDIITRIKEKWVTLVISIIISLGMQIVMSLAAYLAAISFNINVSFLTIMFALCSAMIFQIVPLSLMGIGGGEAAGYLIYHLLGFSTLEAFFMVSIIYIYRVLNSLSGGIWELFEGITKGVKYLNYNRKKHECNQ